MIRLYFPQLLEQDLANPQVQESYPAGPTNLQHPPQCLEQTHPQLQAHSQALRQVLLSELQQVRVPEQLVVAAPVRAVGQPERLLLPRQVFQEPVLPFREPGPGLQWVPELVARPVQGPEWQLYP